MTTLILLPGMDGTGLMFEPLIAHLPKEWDIRVVRYPSNQVLGYEQLLTIVSQAIPSTGSYFLLGESFSGPIAIMLAATADNRLKGVMLCCSFIHCPLSVLHYFGGLLSQYPIVLMPQFIIETVLFGRFRSASLSRLLKAAMNGVANEVLSQRLVTIQNVDVSKHLAQLTVPLIYLRATEDKLIGARQPLSMIQIAQHMSIVELVGPHGLLQASSMAAAQEIVAFVGCHQNEFD